MGANECGISPRRLTDNKIINNENIKAVHEALPFPAARRTTAGNWVLRVSQTNKSRVFSQLGTKIRVIQDGAVTNAIVIIGMIRIGGSNWSNKLRFIFIVGLGLCYR